MFAILFGRSMDYEVFLVSRIDEEHRRGLRNADTVEQGVGHVMRLILAAGAIMVAVFISFAFGDLCLIKEFGVGLATAILVDATVVRLLLVPSLMHLFGAWNWWFPAWLERIVPRLSVEGTPDAAGAVAEEAAA